MTCTSTLSVSVWQKIRNTEIFFEGKIVWSCKLHNHHFAHLENRKKFDSEVL